MNPLFVGIVFESLTHLCHIIGANETENGNTFKIFEIEFCGGINKRIKIKCGSINFERNS